MLFPRLLLALSLTAGLAGPASADILMAINGPMTGSYAIFGDQMKRGAEFIVDRLNAKGGVLGQKIAIMVGDDACDPKQAVAVANKAATAGAKVVIGHYCSGSSIPASDVYHENDILQISPASTNPKLTDDAATKGWKNVFRTCGRDDYQGVIAGRWIAEHFKDKKIAILHDRSPYGKGLADATKAELNKLGVKEALYEAYNPGEKDYSAIISRLKSLGADMVYIGGYHTEVGLMLRQARDQGFNAQFMSGDANATDELLGIAGPAVEGFLFTFGPDPRKNPAAKETVEAIKAQNFEPEGYTLYTVAAVQVWADAAEKAGTVDMPKIAEAIRGHSFDTVLGTLAFDQKGDIKDPKYVLYEFKNGKYSEVGP
ncbi:branched-chain amino acid ABC transporter substrate-binding protein [Microvirga massiliensis]|uniref:branched-chain amino acid ABC transporter substrate-binding protein n=1 Tax=Microvirga massiliensis TaxID=1033741 RepID=UPI00062BCDDD|nr:branched-chain amino acid ABC transporter substrate-binding protein [Microvirga massiliensis]